MNRGMSDNCGVLYGKIFNVYFYLTLLVGIYSEGMNGIILM